MEIKDIEVRAGTNHPRLMLASTTNNDEAKLVIEHWLSAPLMPVNAGCMMSTSRQALSLGHIHVRRDNDNNIRVYGYIKNLHKRNELTASFELSLDTESAKVLADAILKQL